MSKRFTFVLALLAVVALLAVITDFAVAEDCKVMGTQLHAVAVGGKPISANTRAVLIGEYLKTPKTGGELYFATVGIKRVLPQNFWIQPAIGYVGGWFAGNDGLALVMDGGAKLGPLYLALDFKRWSAPSNVRTKFWYHTADLKFGRQVGASPEWTAGIHFNKVDQSERWGAHVANQLSPHVKLEARYYRQLYGHNPLQYCRGVIVVS